ncbi:MAG: C/D box methylation guide ribonucleoprotein complex aNOP56 subunit [Theionarchaea archaeon]|nr:C/D box methylation guide ribonucleoprotein complex aNOP56 subunit [Theionarchaea archaeon]MBU7022238.1 C/D box methylation guide ribonucleoprotein complex aNOP56 subunit [Theionarchaea archaeon]MBU7035120.1 C/D box methylation guide ribonucleoprotein complex aNOP56 subunit [Theionarchaea archaeon]MBU7040254.1 C/D box methylation guide ribonucleoprotein complex aNOP56 subunit [Theionarchaea archaeon]
MMLFATVHVCGIYLCNEEISEFIPFSSSEQYLQVKRGEKVEELDRAVKGREIIFEQKDIADLLGQQHQFPNPAGDILRKTCLEISGMSSIDLHERMREVAFALTREGVKASSEKKDKVIVESVRALDEVDQVLNVLCERLREWHGLFYPQLEKKTKDNYMYATKVVRGGVKGDSMGGQLELYDEERIKEFAGSILNLFEERSELETYITAEAQKAAPNLSSLLGSVLSARLISAAGGLEELARLPSSTIQVLGAEKALFRHLRTGARPPKHGLIFQHPMINRAPRKARGKISRSLAAKIAILARVDCYSSEFVADEIEEQLRERISHIRGVAP